jgi:hypothetical protein
VSDFVLGPGLHLLASFLCAFSFPLSFSFSFVLVNLWVMIRCRMADPAVGVLFLVFIS